MSKHFIPKGKVFTEDDFVYKRPAYGISPKDVYRLVGKTAKQDIPPETFVTWEMVEER